MRILIIAHNGENLSDVEQKKLCEFVHRLTQCSVCAADELNFTEAQTIKCITEDDETKACKEAFKVIELNFRDSIRRNDSLILAVEIVKNISKNGPECPVAVACEVICKAKKNNKFYALAKTYGLSPTLIEGIVHAIRD